MPPYLNTPARAALVLAGLLLFTAPAGAVTPVLWTIETLEDFERGKPDGVGVGSAGELELGPDLRPLNVPLLEESAEPFLWSQAVDDKGNLYVGGGKNGAIYRIPRGSSGSLYFETGDLAVHALAIDRSGALYAGSSPNGQIYRITGEGKGEVYYQPEDRYIWALAVDSDETLYAATGERGIIYRIPSRGRAETFYDSEEPHVVSLAIDADGNLLAGTDGRGLLYRINPDGEATVLHDSPLREISAVTVDKRGVIYAAAIGVEGEPALPPLLQPEQPAPLRERGPVAMPPQPQLPIPGMPAAATTTVQVTASATGPAAAPLPKSEVYRIEPGAPTAVLWSSQSEVIYSLAVDPSGRPVIGTGEPGRIRALSGSRQSTLLATIPQSQVTSLAAGPGKQMFAASSNTGRVYLLDAALSETGTYASPPRDTQTVSRWGQISWRASLPPGARIDLVTRTGNSSVPDATWSEWSAPYTNPEGSRVVSPSARFLQWRARLVRESGGRSPVLYAVSVAYVQANLPPVVTRLTVQPPGIVWERSQYERPADPTELAFTGIRLNPGPNEATPGTPATAGKQIYVRGMRSLDWEAQDHNGDTLSFNLSFRGEGETAWKPLARDLRDTSFAFDSMQLPDGLYRIRLEASDRPSNPSDTVRSATRDSEAFLIDNTPPAVQVSALEVTRKGARTIDATASDTVGPIARAEYSLDAARWVLMQPRDGVSDSRAESYRVTVDSLESGEHTVIVKVSDLLGNVGAGKITFISE